MPWDSASSTTIIGGTAGTGLVSGSKASGWKAYSILSPTLPNSGNPSNLGLTTEEGSAEGGPASDSREPIDHSLARSRIEALLLIAKSPLNYRRLASLAELEDATQARTLVAELNELYDSNGRGIRIEQIAGGCRLMTRAVVSPWLRRLGVLPPAIRLSWPMMETLAIVAYRQDVTRAGVEAVRGVACGEILRQLMSLELVRISGRSDDLGRPYLYGTTKRFLKICGLASINALPAIDSQGFCDDVSHPSDIDSPGDADSLNAESANENPVSPSPESDVNAGSPVSKEPDVSLAVTDALATDSVLSTIAHAGEAYATAVVDPLDPNAASIAAESAAGIPAAVIEDEEDDLYEKGLEDDDDEDFVDDEEDDWDDDDDDDDTDDDDDLDDDDDVEDDDAEDSWEEVDDDEADEEWDDDEDDEEDDDWDDDDDEEEEEEESDV